MHFTVDNTGTTIVFEYELEYPMDHPFADWFKHMYDFRMVRPPQITGDAYL